jgi:RNA recognition motif-containing protein
VRLVVSNLTRNVTVQHLREIFATYGPLADVDLPLDRSVNLPKGYAHVEYEVATDAQRAIDFMHEGQIDGNVIK